MRTRSIPFTYVVLAALAAVGCAGRVRIPPETADHPASPDAASAPASVVGPLEPDAFDREEPTPGAGHQHPVTRESGAHGDHGATPPAAPAAQAYVCPMHPEVVQSQPSRCPKCGMALVPRKEKK